MPLLETACNFLVREDAPAPCDLIFVLAGRMERKPYGLQLFSQSLAPRLIISTGRFEVRQTAAALGNIPELLALRDQTPPERRHFWLDFKHDQPAIVVAGLKRASTFWELHALASYLEAEPPTSITVISTSIHLRRVQLCCARIPFFKDKVIRFLPVPEQQSSFRREKWWKRTDHWSYLVSEYVKLVGYGVVY